MHISPYEQGNQFNRDPLRVKKLLLHKSEIRKLDSAVMKQGYTLVPLDLYLKDGRVKMTLGLCLLTKRRPGFIISPVPAVVAESAYAHV